MVKYSVALDPFSGESLVLEASTDFQGWVVVFRCHSLVEAHKQRAAMEEAQAEVLTEMLRAHGEKLDGQ